MGRVERRIFYLVLGVLLLSLGGMLIQNLSGRGEPVVYHVTVLLDGAGEDGWQSFRKGVTRAAQERNADVRFVTRYDGEDIAAAQAEALRREWEGEADGAVVLPADAGALAAGLQDAPAEFKVVCAGAGVDSDKVSSSLSADGEAMGRALAQAVADDGRTACTIYRREDGAGPAGAFDGLTGALDALGIPWRTVRPPREGEALPAGALLAVEPDLAEELSQREDGAGRLYGIGSSGKLLQALEEGRIAALVVQSDYDLGYLSIQRLVGALEGKSQEDVTLGCYTVTQETMFTDPLDQILFPIA